VRAYSELYPGTSQGLLLEDHERADVRFLTNETLEKSFITSYEQYYAARNPWTDAMFSTPEGNIHMGDWLAPRQTLENCEFYHDWLKPQNLHDGFGTTVLKSNGQMMFFTLLHSAEIATGPRDLELLNLIVPHMQRAARLHGHFLELQARCGATEDLLDTLSIGTLLCDKAGRIQFMNKAAQAMVLAGDGLSLIAGRLVPALKAEANLLERLLARAAVMAEGGPVSTGGAASISRPSGRRPYGLTIAPYRGEAPRSPWERLAPAIRVVIFVTDPELRQPPPEELLAGLLGLTPAEARMAGLLMLGRSLEEVSESCGITRETARSRLKQLFSKTGTHSQPELIALILRSLPPAGICHAPELGA
jgi:DNA-binding CsgD family transcriptional regulator